MDYLELFVARSAQGHHGDGRSAPRVGTDGLVAAAFEHRSSRADDPQLHTHVVIANLIRRADGQWTAIDSAALYHHMLTAGYIYQAVLRGELTRRLGVDWTSVRRGVAEITGIPKGLCRAFSQRRQAIEARLAARGETGRIAAQQACLDTRPAKPPSPEATQRERWRERALASGFDPEQRTTVPSLPMPGEIDADSVVATLAGPDGLTAKRSTFDPRDVLRGICETIPGGANIDLDRLLELGRAVVRSQDTVPLLHSAWPGERSYSTTEMLTAEAQGPRDRRRQAHCGARGPRSEGGRGPAQSGHSRPRAGRPRTPSDDLCRRGESTTLCPRVVDPGRSEQLIGSVLTAFLEISLIVCHSPL